MKIESVEILNDGLKKHAAEEIWEQTEANAQYQFNKSHSVEYSVVSVWTMYLRVRYPAEYFAACMSIVKEDKLPSLVTDARQYGIEVMPPDINLSTSQFTIPDDKHILSPFTAVLGISDTIAERIVHFRKAEGGKFKDHASFLAIAASKGSKINARVVDRLERVGALFPLLPGSLAPRHMDRRKDQTELMPGLIIDAVKATRSTDGKDKFVRAKVLTVLADYRKCEDCSLKDSPHPAVRMGSNIKYMVVSDCPSWQEEKKDSLLEGDAAAYVKRAIKAAGMSPSDGYFTTLVKAKKDDKFLTNQQLNGCRRFIERELEIIKPPLIIALGSASVKYFVPSIKGGVGEHAGRIVYDSKLEASIVCGINSQQIGFNPSMTDVLDDVFMKAADVLS